jgi:hypothetical protein
MLLLPPLFADDGVVVVGEGLAKSSSSSSSASSSSSVSISISTLAATAGFRVLRDDEADVAEVRLLAAAAAAAVEEDDVFDEVGLVARDEE